MQGAVFIFAKSTMMLVYTNQTINQNRTLFQQLTEKVTRELQLVLTSATRTGNFRQDCLCCVCPQKRVGFGCSVSIELFGLVPSVISRITNKGGKDKFDRQRTFTKLVMFYLNSFRGWG